VVKPKGHFIIAYLKKMKMWEIGAASQTWEVGTHILTHPHNPYPKKRERKKNKKEMDM
jgi:hypothetical protein